MMLKQSSVRIFVILSILGLICFSTLLCIPNIGFIITASAMDLDTDVYPEIPLIEHGANSCTFSLTEDISKIRIFLNWDDCQKAMMLYLSAPWMDCSLDGPYYKSHSKDNFISLDLDVPGERFRSGESEVYLWFLDGKMPYHLHVYDLTQRDVSAVKIR